MDFHATTKLEAINQLLSVIGERKINSLTNLPIDAALADSILDEVAVQVQAGDMFFNTDPEVTLARDVNNEIPLSGNVIRINPHKQEHYPDLPTMRTGQYKLYNKYTQDYTFSKDVVADVTYFIDWVDLPQPVRSYIIARSSRLLNDRTLDSQSLRQALVFNESLTRQEMLSWDSEESDSNIFDDPSVAQSLHRRNPLNGMGW